VGAQIPASATWVRHVIKIERPGVGDDRPRYGFILGQGQ